jgi:hypothetical protein
MSRQKEGSSTNVVTERRRVCAGDTDDCRDSDDKGIQETSAVVSMIYRVCRVKMSAVESYFFLSVREVTFK